MSVSAGPKAGLRAFTFSERELAGVRRDIYHSEGPGYHLFRGFLGPELAAHVRGFWTARKPEIQGDFQPLRNRPFYTVGEGPFASHYPGKSAYYFALWNSPPDDVTHAAAAAVTQLRNQIEQQPLFRDLLPCGPMMTFYLVAVSTDSAEDVEWHNDEFPETSGGNPSMRLQATLFLSEYGRDYEGEGMRFEDNQGKVLEVGRDLKIECGDLLVWRYANRHGVGSVKPVAGGAGYVRVLFGLENVKAAPFPKPESAAQPAPEASLLRRAARKIKAKLGRKNA